jgi:hypothetical protein
VVLAAPAWYSSELSLGARTGAGSFIVALAATTMISGMLRGLRARREQEQRG